MSLLNLLPKLLTGDPERETAARDLRGEDARLAVSVGVHPQRRELVASEVTYKVLVSVKSGAIARWRDPEAPALHELIVGGLAKLPPLTPGDFGAVQRRRAALGERVTLERMFALLRAEALERGRPERAAGFANAAVA